MKQEEISQLHLNIQKSIRLFHLLDQNVTPCGFHLSPSQVFALQELEAETTTIGELSDKLLLERSTVSRLVDGLVKGGFITRELNEDNRREVLVSLSDKGRKSLHHVLEQSFHFYESILEQLTDYEQSQILQGMELFTQSLFKYREKKKHTHP
ncbi:MAG TPA: MarR family transcriptional regulator [Bacillota bacterium]|nr:MarR family transcriptional regulator [Bacillota bacterium]